ncbi:MAG TPA: GNAT family N-acetyltransferase [Nocardioides sp.]|nr:GNAT family N-acetyltransferase [Nocardioides sp.]
MSRSPLVTRLARREDAAALVGLWSDVLRRTDPSDQVADLELVIKQAAVSPEQRLVVVEYDGEVAGAVFLRLTTLSPINLEPCVQSVQPRVLPHLRRHGVGRALMDAATSYAEENGLLHVTTAVPSTSREANRFMARLGFGPVATIRLATTSVVRQRITPPTATDRGLNKVLAARRSQRRVARAAVERVAFVEPTD